MRIDCRYCSIWDGGWLVEMPARLDLDSGLVVDIQHPPPPGDDDYEPEALDREYLAVDGIDGEFKVTSDDPGPPKVADLSAVKAALKTAEAGRDAKGPQP